MLTEDGSTVPHLRSVRTVLYMLALSLVAVTAVILYSYCHLHRLCSRLATRLRAQ